MRNKKLYMITAYVLIMMFMALPAQAAQTLNINWFAPYYDNTASVILPESGQADTSFSFQGEIDSKYKAVLVKIVKGQDSVYYYYPVNNNTVSGQVYLRFGKGTYQVEINVVKPDPNPAVIAFDKLARTSIENTAEGDGRYLLPSWGIESDNQAIVKLANQITKDIKTDYDKIKAVHNWVSKNITYDMEKYKQGKFYDNEGAVKALETKKGLCRDYSNLTTALLRAVGIEARTVIGQAATNGSWYGHAWTEAKVGDRWISMDTTWDAGNIKNGGFVPKFSEKYFDMAQTEFDKTHKKTMDVY